MRTIFLSLTLTTAACASRAQPVAHSSSIGSSIGSPSMQGTWVADGTEGTEGTDRRALAPAASTSAAGETSSVGTTDPAASDPSRPTDAGQRAGLSDAQSVAVMQTANHWRIEQAHVALRTSQSARVKRLAQGILRDASADNEGLSRFDDRNGITPRSSPVAEQISFGWEPTLSSLASAKATDFDRLYVAAQVTQYTEALSILDDTLLPHVQDPDLMTALRRTRTEIAGHLKVAQQLQAALPGSP